ncbi:MAG: hypothetical protein A2015_10375 [Spirochaetes bacterium GWF1_31_7]|nr:MAG: hypothetical protein A2Y30_16110 [Spirochaetes bacterium GWE1_32_154]OHD48505.1 MAG: hypothetical protein A2Y29_14085 [Spirochaetes bacterium GWE2_31_10]OHD51419.1 MAG: hypothetical protein A2015_10375 [Spirochaetes bacterium GWF1_31_7]OHD79944.1 MAG: hypothetical protein A2355_12890 [Spirochaetes bacterium RIFOXYB1_FULL_32_8]
MKKYCSLLFLFFTFVYGNAEQSGATDWFKNGVGYEIFFRSFYDSNGDGIGDIKGLIEKLDYLNDGVPGGNDLDIDFIWLTPIFQSGSFHGYDVIDYYTINPRYGTMEDFDTLIVEADKRGIRIILDLVLNHCSHKHPYFLEAAGDKTSSKRDWFLFSETNKTWMTWKKTSWGKIAENDYFWGTFGLPDWNAENPDTKAYLFDIARFWLAKGIGGFRLDAIKHLIEEEDNGKEKTINTAGTLSWLRDFSKMVKDINPEAVLIGEIWDSIESIAEYVNPEGANIDAAFNFGLRGTLFNIFGFGAKMYSKKVEYSQNALLSNDSSVVFSGNHDMQRLASEITTVDDLKAVAKMLFITPGIPFIYYGDEIRSLHSMGTSGDMLYRNAMAWSNAKNAGFTTAEKAKVLLSTEWEKRNVQNELSNKNSVLHTYIEMIQLRKSIPGFNNARWIEYSSTKDVASFFIETKTELYYCTLNISDKNQNVTIQESEIPVKDGVKRSMYEEFYPKHKENKWQKINGIKKIRVKSHELIILKLQ